MLLLTRRITRHAAVLANAARKTSWAAPEAPSWLRRVEHWLRPPAPSGDPLQLLPWELTSPAALEVDGSDTRRRPAVIRGCRRAAERRLSRRSRRVPSESGGTCGRGDAPGGRRGRRRGRRFGRLPLRRRVAARTVPARPAPRRRAGVAAIRFADLGAIWQHVRAALGEDAVLRRRASSSACRAPDQAPEIPSARWRRGVRRIRAGPTRRVPRLGGARADVQSAHSLVVFLPLCDLNEKTARRRSCPARTSAGPPTRSRRRDAPGSSSAGAPAILDVDAGDAVVFDSRTQHAGGANRSQRARPILCLVFARPWFDEAMHRRLVGGAGGGDGAQRLFPEFPVAVWCVIFVLLFRPWFKNLRFFASALG